MKKNIETLNHERIMQNTNNTLWWVNHYDRHGNVTDSVPYESVSLARETTNEVIAVCNQFMTEPLQMYQVGMFAWQDKRGRAIRIERIGYPLLHIKNEWVAISANYTTEVPTDWWFINTLYEWFGLNTDAMEKFAEPFYESGLYRVFAEPLDPALYDELEDED